MEIKSDFFATENNPICNCHYNNDLCFICEYSLVYCSIKNACGLCSPLIPKPLYKILDTDFDDNSSSNDENELYDEYFMLNLFKTNQPEAKILASIRVKKILKNMK